MIGKNLNKIGYIHEVKSAISEFMQYGVSVEQLQNMIGQTGRRGALQSKLQDLSVLYEKFSGYIREKYMTNPDWCRGAWWFLTDLRDLLPFRIMS